MSQPIPETDLSKATVGQVLSVSLAQVKQAGTGRAQIASNTWPHLTLQNRSGFGLLITLPSSSVSFNLPPNALTKPFPVHPDEQAIQITVNYGAPYGPNTGNRLFGDYFYAYEQPGIVQQIAVDTLSQPRTVQVPIAPQGGAFFFGTPAQGATSIITSANLSSSTAVYSNRLVNLYLYSLSVQTRNAGWTVFSVTWQFLDQFNTVQGSQNVFGGIVDGSGTVADRQVVYHSPYPISMQRIPIPAACYPFPLLRCVFVVFLQQNPGTNDFWVHINTGFDHLNEGVPGDIGNFTQPNDGLINPATF